MTASDTQLLSQNQRDHGDVVALFGVAIVLISVHLWLPSRLASEFVFTYGNPSLVTAWTAATIHDSTGHLVSNLAWYGVVIGLAYALYTIWSRHRLFWLLYGSLLVISPLITVAVDYWFLYQQWELVGPNSIAFGFSSVVSAFGGLLVVGLAGVVAEWYSWRISTVTTLAFILSGLAGATVRSPFISFESTELMAAGILAVAAVGILLGWNRRRFSPQQWLSTHYDAVVTVGACGFVLTALVAGMFTVEGVSAGRFSNVLAHGTGFVTGVSVAAAGSHLV